MYCMSIILWKYQRLVCDNVISYVHSYTIRIEDVELILKKLERSIMMTTQIHIVRTIIYKLIRLSCESSRFLKYWFKHILFRHQQGKPYTKALKKCIYTMVCVCRYITIERNTKGIYYVQHTFWNICCVLSGEPLLLFRWWYFVCDVAY